VAAPRLEGLTASINARNVGDKQFVATCTAISACYYGQGRSVTARLQYRW
jgi:iron complex outermembrane receptor protein